MNKNFLTLAAALALSTILAGCGSSPSNNYHRLTATVATAPQGETPSLGVGPIDIPAYLDREKLVYQQEGTSLQVASTEHWAEPLGAGIERVLALNLAGLLNTQDMQTFPWHPQRAPDYGVRVNLLTLDTNSNEAVLTAEWLVYRPEDAQTVQRRISSVQKPLNSGQAVIDDIPAVYSELLFQLSEIIAAAIDSAEIGRAHV